MKRINLDASLTVIASELRSGGWPLLDYLAKLEKRFNEREPDALGGCAGVLFRCNGRSRRIVGSIGYF